MFVNTKYTLVSQSKSHTYHPYEKTVLPLSYDATGICCYRCTYQCISFYDTYCEPMCGQR